MRLTFETEKIDHRIAVDLEIVVCRSGLQPLGWFVEELADDAVGHARDDRLSIPIETIELAQGSGEFDIGDRSRVLAEPCHHLSRLPAVEPVHHQLGLAGYDFFYVWHRRVAATQILVECRLELVDVVEHNAFKRADTKIDVPRHSYIHNHQGQPLPLFESGRHVLRVHDGVWGASGGDHCVGARQSLGQFHPRPSLAAGSKSEVLGRGQGTIDA